MPTHSSVTDTTTVPSAGCPKQTWGGCELVTWPGMLVLHRGLGYWACSRVEDMFHLVRSTPSAEYVDPAYWA